MVTTTVDVQPGEVAARAAHGRPGRDRHRRQAAGGVLLGRLQLPGRAPGRGLSPVDRRDHRRARGRAGSLACRWRRAARAPPSPATRCRAGVVLDTSRHLNRVLSVDPEQRTAVVEPGTVLDAITTAAAPHGLRFGPDPSTHSRCTIGGAIGNNACGSRALRYGRTADNVVALDVVTGSGLRFTAARHGDDRAGGRSRRRGAAAGVAEAALLADLRALAGAQPGGHQDRVRPVHPAGVRLLAEHLLPENGFDVAKFLVRDRGDPGADPRRDRPSGGRAARHRAGGARLPGHARGRRGRARPAAAPAGRARGPRLADGGPRPRPPRPGRGARPAARRRLAVRRDGRRRRSRRRSPRRASSSRTARAWTAR